MGTRRPQFDGAEMATYIVPHRAGWKYKRAVPPALQSTVGRKQWTNYIKARTQREAEERARAIAAEHDQLIARLKTLSPDERLQLAKSGGVGSAAAAIKMDEAALAFVEAATDLPPDVDSERSEDVQAKQALEQLKDRKLADQMRAELEARKKALRKLNGVTREAGSPFACDGVGTGQETPIERNDVENDTVSGSLHCGNRW